jgi:hypothetical protein
MSDWFFMLGEPMARNEREQVRDYVRELGVEHDMPVEEVSTWTSARDVITNPDWDRRFWDAERLERQRLYGNAEALRGPVDFVRSLSRTLESSDAVYAAAAVEAARRNCTDMGFIGAAAGAASEALHLAQLAEVAGERPAHPFLLKKAVFAAGHWPLGALRGRYFVF